MQKRYLVEQNITRIQEYVGELIEGTKWHNISSLETSLIIVGNSDDDYDFAILFVPNKECVYCEFISDKIEYIDCEVDREECNYEGRTIFQYINGKYEKLRGVIFHNAFHQLENCYDECVCDTCSLQGECYNLTFCDILGDVPQSAHLVNKGPIKRYLAGLTNKPINSVSKLLMENNCKYTKSIFCSMVLRLMDTEEYSNNYCKSLDLVLRLFPEVSRELLEKELDRYI